ncbi:MAG: M15 family metallopeptidase [Candidatus Vogelbacteria bacterium]|nr:M15 family metallopeptidase [Candidatus Vogelbacteria bacterium]
MKNRLPNFIPTIATFVILGSAIIYDYYKINDLTIQMSRLKSEVASTAAKQAARTEEIFQNLSGLQSQTAGLSNSLTNTQQNIDAVTTKVGGIEQTVGTVTGTVGSLQKLAKIDPELLKKYSKIFFMSENYTPAHIYTIPDEYVYSSKHSEQFVAEAWPFLKAMLDAAKADNVSLLIKSGYRSFAEQQTLKSRYTVVYGAGTANSFSAEQGYSEHQLGTTVDVITSGIAGNLDKFDGTKAYEWMKNNAYKFGFEQSYPKGNNYYVYEPWHWRFVGVKLATDLHNRNMNFYSMDQRDIDNYLINIFD